MVVECESLYWAEGRKEDQRDGAAWGETFARFPALQYAVCDAGMALHKGLKLTRAARRRAGRTTPLEAGLDVFHTLREGSRVLRAAWRQVSKALDQAAERERVRDERVRQGRSCRGAGAAVAMAWRKAERLWDEAMVTEAAWGRIRGALELFTTEGRLGTRAQSAAVLAEALPQLTGPKWAKTRRLLSRPEALTFLDRAQERLAGLGLPEDVLACVLELEGLARRADPDDAVARGRMLVRTVQLAKAEANGTKSVQRVRQALRSAWRASSLVECLNSVARMQQSRHRRMTQGLLDLKRLYWNCRAFRTGRRRAKRPYQMLGLKLPTSDWWELLKLSPEQLKQQVSAAAVTI